MAALEVFDMKIRDWFLTTLSFSIGWALGNYGDLLEWIIRDLFSGGVC